ncbi:MAG: flagellar hook-basal body complex protein FliE [Bacteriovoracales bacterium]|nr:flagellar hook-basal body complex protein FliE [Bacteriovoracales bacterium]
MAVENFAGVRDILNSYETRNWVQGTRVDGIQHKLKISNDSENKQRDNVSKLFIDFLSESVNQVNDLQKDANLAVEKLASGKSKNIHETMLMVEQAEIAFKVMNQVRSKVIDAYREVMRIQI